MERVAVVGSRDGADLEAVHDFVVALRAKHPDTIIVSGGARGVDTVAEQTWLLLGGQVESYRPVELAMESYGIQKWELGGPRPRIFTLLEEPTWANFKSAALYRDILIAEVADRAVAFFRPGRSRGAGFTAEVTAGYGKPVYEYEAEDA